MKKLAFLFLAFFSFVSSTHALTWGYELYVLQNSKTGEYKKLIDYYPGGSKDLLLRAFFKNTGGKDPVVKNVFKDWDYVFLESDLRTRRTVGSYSGKLGPNQDSKEMLSEKDIDSAELLRIKSRFFVGINFFSRIQSIQPFVIPNAVVFFPIAYMALFFLKNPKKWWWSLALAVVLYLIIDLLIIYPYCYTEEGLFGCIFIEMFVMFFAKIPLFVFGAILMILKRPFWRKRKSNEIKEA